MSSHQFVSDKERREKCLARNGHPLLTSREIEVAKLICSGKSSKEASSVLNISTKTVETHRANLMRKLGCHSIIELYQRLANEGVVIQNALVGTNRDSAESKSVMNWILDLKLRDFLKLIQV